MSVTVGVALAIFCDDDAFNQQVAATPCTAVLYARRCMNTLSAISTTHCTRATTPFERDVFLTLETFRLLFTITFESVQYYTISFGFYVEQLKSRIAR